jgi:aspartyl-tRNA(Asn)/glutamyl-tRNA(Gln) amidotransferase subunit A
MISCLPTIANALQAMRAGDLTSEELIDFCLSRIELYEPAIQAWVVVDAAGARQAARRLDQLGRQGSWLGPLHGIPVGIKDIIDVEGFPTRAGSTLSDPRPAAHDALHVRQLRAAGAVILGKTVTTEFACFHPAKTKNPWRAGHTPGGSSSGSAAAVASQMCMAAIGTQTGGSILRPASYCGVVGFKPTRAAVALDGVVPVSPHLDHAGPIARTVDDVVQVYAALTGPPAAASVRIDFPDQPPLLRCIEQYFFAGAAAACGSVVRAAVERLWCRGSAPPLSIPDSFADVHVMHRRIMYVDAAEYHERAFRLNRADFSTTMANMLQEGISIPGVEYARALRHQNRFSEDIRGCFEEQNHFAATPATPTAAPPSLETTGDPSFNSPWTYAGVPAVTLPCGLDEVGMPIGLQLIGGPHRDEDLLRAAAWCETRLGLKLQPSMTGY